MDNGISILVTNYSYSYLLPLVMQSYNRMELPPCPVEMIIVDDSSDPDDHFEEFVRLGIGRIHPSFKVRAFKMPLECSKMNVGRTINVAAKLADGDLFIFNHADCIHLSKDTLRLIYDFHNNVAPSDMYLLFSTFVNTKPEQFGVITNLTNPAGSSLPRELFEEMGGFDEELDGYGHEDADFYWRLHYGREIGGKHHWKEATEPGLFMMHMNICSIGLKRSVYPNPHNGERVNYNMEHRNWTVNPDGWGICDGLEEIEL